MTKDELQTRIQELNQLREQHLANANAVTGAIQELTGWLNKVNAAEPTKPKRGRPTANDYPKVPEVETEKNG
jgi:hypothetical protein